MKQGGAEFQTSVVRNPFMGSIRSKRYRRSPIIAHLLRPGSNQHSGLCEVGELDRASKLQQWRPGDAVLFVRGNISHQGQYRQEFFGRNHSAEKAQVFERTKFAISYIVLVQQLSIPNEPLP